MKIKFNLSLMSVAVAMVMKKLLVQNMNHIIIKKIMVHI